MICDGHRANGSRSPWRDYEDDVYYFKPSAWADGLAQTRGLRFGVGIEDGRPVPVVQGAPARVRKYHPDEPLPICTYPTVLLRTQLGCSWEVAVQKYRGRADDIRWCPRYLPHAKIAAVLSAAATPAYHPLQSIILAFFAVFRRMRQADKAEKRKKPARDNPLEW